MNILNKINTILNKFGARPPSLTTPITPDIEDAILTDDEQYYLMTDDEEYYLQLDEQLN
jgi:hypothetical protein